jgi:hypothetical protein
LKDVSSPNQTQTPTSETPPASTKAKTDTPTVPDTYTFKPPAEGVEPDKDMVEAAIPVFKELELTQAEADKLSDLYNRLAKNKSDIGLASIKAMGEKWESEAKVDPYIGPNLDKIKVDVGRAMDQIELARPGIKSRFANAMNMTMAGSNPAFIETFWELSKSIIEGKHVVGGGPSQQGQTANGQSQRPSIAQAMYPNEPNDDLTRKDQTDGYP